MPHARVLADKMLSAINDHKVEKVLRYVRDDAVFISPLGVAEGHQEIARYFEHFFNGFPDICLTVWHRVSGAVPAFTEWMITGTHTGPFTLPGGEVIEGTGRRIAVRGCGASVLQEGLIVTHRDYFDQLELYSQLGFVLVPAASR